MNDTELKQEILRLKKEKNAVILGHYYQRHEIQELSDYVGDSLALAQKAQEATADIIVFCGVHFMAETAKILNPSRKVLLPDMEASCSLAESCKGEDFAKFKAEHPDHMVISMSTVQPRSRPSVTSSALPEMPRNWCDRCLRNRKSSLLPTRISAVISTRSRDARWCSGTASAPSTTPCRLRRCCS